MSEVHRAIAMGLAGELGLVCEVCSEREGNEGFRGLEEDFYTWRLGGAGIGMVRFSDGELVLYTRGTSVRTGELRYFGGSLDTGYHHSMRFELCDPSLICQLRERLDLR